MSHYLEPEDDGLPMRPSGQWALKKLDYLERYINVFVTAMREKWRAMHYIDLFSGPGKCLDSDSKSVYLGSPLLALKAPYPFTNYFFVDLDADNISALKQRCEASPQSERVRYFVGDSNHLVSSIVDHISQVDHVFLPGQRSSLNLAFLDPDGLELHWETVATLAQLNRIDLIIHYSEMGLERSMPKLYKAPGTTSVDVFFGGPQWRQIYEKWCGDRILLHRHLIDHYKENLCSLGYVDVLRDDETGLEPLMRSTKKNAPLYRLLFASKHERGHDFWKKVTRRDVHGQRRLF